MLGVAGVVTLLFPVYAGSVSISGKVSMFVDVNKEVTGKPI